MTVQTFEPLTGTNSDLIYSPVYWETDSFAGALIKRSSFFVPVKLRDIKETLYMQFDLGANRSMLYGQTLSALCAKYPELKNDTINKETYSIYKNASIAVNDSQTLIAKQLYILNDFGQSNIDTTFIIIGTFGFDILGNHILILDFKSDRYAITENIPTELKSKVSYINKADLHKFPIILPFTLGNKKIRLFYDTGSSMFPILTGTNRLKKISNHRKIQPADSVSSWGKMIPIYKPAEIKEKAENLKIRQFDLGKVNIYGEPRLNKLAIMCNYLYGITGNVVFENKILVIDRKNNQFGVIN